MIIAFETFTKVLMKNFQLNFEEFDINNYVILSHQRFESFDLFVKLEHNNNIVSVFFSKNDYFADKKEINRYDLRNCDSELEIIDFFVNILIQKEMYHLIYI